MTNQWAIIDNHGKIYDGTEDQMKAVWADMVAGIDLTDWIGDLLLVEIHAVCH